MPRHLLQPLLKAGIAFVHCEISDSKAQGFVAADEYTDALGPGDACVNEISLQHHVVGHQDGNNRYGEFRALVLVYSCGVG